MTIAQQKIKDYCKANKISQKNLSLKLGYNITYIDVIMKGVYPKQFNSRIIEKVFDIKNDEYLIPDILLDKYRFADSARFMFNSTMGFNIPVRTFCYWIKGKRPRNKEQYKALCRFAGVKNEWTEDI